MTDREPAAVAEEYFRAWKAKDWPALESLLHPDATFDGPLANLQGAQPLIEGLQGMGKILEDVVVHHRWVDGPDVLTWFDLHSSVAPPAPTANWTHVEDGKITAVQVTFDARPLAPPS
jgi:hypothetical protein